MKITIYTKSLVVDYKALIGVNFCKDSQEFLNYCMYVGDISKEEASLVAIQIGVNMVKSMSYEDEIPELEVTVYSDIDINQDFGSTVMSVTQYSILECSSDFKSTRFIFNEKISKTVKKLNDVLKSMVK